MLPLPTLLLTTKLYCPPADANWVARPKLLACLQDGLRTKLTLISAPPGFGKTTLTSQWLAGCSLPSAWLSLDEGDNDLIQFLRYLVAAVRTCTPAACPTTQSLLAATNLPGVDYLADVLVSELTTLTEPMILALDDFHAIRASEVHQVMRHLLRYRPPALHLVILTRTDPPLHLGRLRAAQQITEIRAGDLRFAVDETRRFLDQRLGQALDEDALNLLHARTEGWITALQLSSIALQRQEPHRFLSQFHGNDRLLVGYLVEEVMERLAEPLRNFLLYTALVDRFCAPLADVLLADCQPPGSSQTLIAQLEAQNLFIIPLDQGGEWMRYHDLFRDFLRHQLKRVASPATLAHLHQRASAWFAEVGLIEEALHHAVAAGDESAAAELVITQLHPMLDSQIPALTLARWLALFPATAIQAQPQLRLAQAWLSAFGIVPSGPAVPLEDIARLIQADLTLPVARRQALMADLNLLRGAFAYWGGDAHQSIALLQAGLAQQSPTHLFARSQALLHLAGAHACIGEQAVGHTLLRTALAEAKTQQRPTLMILLGGLAILHLLAGELSEVIHTAYEAVAAMDELGGRALWQDVGFAEMWYAWGHYLLGIAHYEQNDLVAATHHWQQVETMRYRTNPGVSHGSLLGLALIAQAHDAPGETLAYAQAAREFAAKVHRPMSLALSASFEARLALLNGQAADALRRTQSLEVTADQGIAFGVELPPLTRLRALSTAATPAILLEGAALAATCLRNAENAHNTQQVIQLCALQALILHGLRRTEEAFDALARSLTLGESGGFVRTFVDLGAPMAGLLRLFQATRGQSDQVKRVLAAFPPAQDAAERRALTSQYAKLYGITPLTPRELELLALIRQRLSIDEIAATLVISPNTVKKHANNVYTKLGVRNRREALAKAEELSLLPPLD
jgi:LuxR family transcriptional regulator, maltose regulon positive regulatory protein